MRTKPAVGDAQAFLDRALADFPRPASPPQYRSLDDVRQALIRDDVLTFRDAIAFTSAQPGPEAKAYLSLLELLLGEAQIFASGLLDDAVHAVAMELRQAEAQLAMQRSISPEVHQQLMAWVDRLRGAAATSAALRVVGTDHLRRGGELAGALATEAKSSAATYLVGAYHARLRGDWIAFEAHLAEAEKRDLGTLLGHYLRGLGQMEKERNGAKAAVTFKECLQREAKFARAQAMLVLLAPDPQKAYDELLRLRDINAYHFLVPLLGPTLEAVRQAPDSVRAAPGAAPPKGTPS